MVVDQICMLVYMLKNVTCAVSVFECRKRWRDGRREKKIEGEREGGGGGRGRER